MSSVSIERAEPIAVEPALALAGLLGVVPPDLAAGEPLPLLWHWLYLLDRVAQADLGSDGHPVRGTIPAPPAPGRRRMWAGGQVRSHGGLLCGELASRRTRVLKTEEKTGKSGALTFLTVEHVLSQRGRRVIEEQQHLVYLPAASGPPPPACESAPMPLADGDFSIEVTPVLLFRFSALTYNAHRIHYDRDYAREKEGYPGLLTHGPLQALVMAEAARARDASTGRTEPRTWFSYRLTAPLLDFQGLVARADPSADGYTTRARDRYGRETANGRIE